MHTHVHLLILAITIMIKASFGGSMEKEMATHSSTLAWKIPWTEEPGRLQSMGSQRAGHDLVTSLHFHLIVQTVKNPFGNLKTWV